MQLFAHIHRFLAPRRRSLFVLTAAVVLLSVLAFREIRLEENIAAMLPDGPVRSDFALLEQAPFARKVLLSLALAPDADAALLATAVDRLRGALGPPWFDRVVAGPADMAQGNIIAWLTAALPNLVDAAELESLAAGLDAAEIENRLHQVRDRLLSPEGWVLKDALRRDPLGLNRLGMAKLQHLNLVPQAQLDSGRFVSADGRHALLIADTPVAITDSGGAEQMLRALDAALAQLPPEVRATVVSGHRYTVANAGAIQRDLGFTLTASMLALLLLFLVFLRHGRALFPFLVPISVLCLAALAVAVGYGTVSAVTLGFGAVLLGISVDYAVHVYFALRHGGRMPAEIIAEVARPVLFGGFTTIAAFAVLLASELPGQRQLAIFAISGLGAALLLSLVVLPQLIPPAAAGNVRSPAAWLRIGERLPRKWIIGAWAAILLLSLWPASHLRIDGDLRSLSLVPAEIRAAEQEVQAVWGEMRGMAMAFAEGPDLESALSANARLFDALGEKPAMAAVSLAPLLPPAGVQERHRRAWRAFWQGEQGLRIQDELRSAAGRLGFAAGAFDPFFHGLAAPVEKITPAGLRQAGLGEMVEAMVLPTQEGYRVLTLVPDGAATIAFFDDRQQDLPTVRLISQGRFGRQLSQAISADFSRFLTLAILVVALFVGFLFRRPKPVLLALLPVATGLAVMFGIMGLTGLNFTLLNIVATALIIGLGVDYGIFMVCKFGEAYDHGTDQAVLVSGLSTIAGFGALILARHPALHSIGVTVLLGIGAAIPAALLVIPAFYRGERR